MKYLLRKVGFFVAFILPGMVVTGFYLGGRWNYLTLFFAFLVLPVLDQTVGIDPYNVPPGQIKKEANAFYYRFITYVWSYVQFFFVVWGAYAVTTGRLVTFWDWTGFILSFAIVSGGIGITVAHELGHKKAFIERFYSKVLLMTVCYMHFYIEHNRGHHVAVATPADPATARKNEPFFAFWVRSVTLSYVDAWQLENERLRKKGLSVWSFQNEMIAYTLLPFLFCAALTLAIGMVTGHLSWQIPLFFFSQSIAAFTLLELVNYVEHYGIVRREISPGRFERVNPTHSWNSSHLISNFFLFQLQRHSDHHASAHKRYQVLHHYDSSPQLPSGYSTMILLALIPPWWFAVMNHRLEVWQTQVVKATVEAQPTHQAR